jgi:hypothetical protein
MPCCPLFLVGTLGVSIATVGLIEGIAEATASVAKLFSGALSDWVGRRKASESRVTGRAGGVRPPFQLRRTQLAKLHAAYWRTLAVVAVFTLARFSEAFLLLRAQDKGLPTAWMPLVFVLMNLVYVMLLAWRACRPHEPQQAAGVWGCPSYLTCLGRPDACAFTVVALGAGGGLGFGLCTWPRRKGWCLRSTPSVGQESG